ncbi:EcsC family protein [Micromonospora palomenae]|uniref:EcsC family protein n=1 Tax=Micromonospora palomenae TaxID=1461247 RepID=UPI003F8BC9D1
MRDQNPGVLFGDDSEPISEGVDATESVTSDPTRLERFSNRAKALSEKLSTVGVDGRGPWKGSIQIAEEHFATHGDREKAIQRLITTHVRLASSTGFLAGLGGLITLPVTLPADLTALWLTQARLAGAIAHLRGYDIRSEEVRSVVLMSLIGSSATEALSQAGIQIGTKSAVSVIKQVPGRVLIQINKTVGFRLITKAGTKGVVNLTKLAPVVGGVVGGGVNLTSTRAVGAWAKKNFPAVDVAEQT